MTNDNDTRTDAERRERELRSFVSDRIALGSDSTRWLLARLDTRIDALAAANAALTREQTRLREALGKIASVETRPDDRKTWPGRGLVACRDTAAAALSPEQPAEQRGGEAETYETKHWVEDVECDSGYYEHICANCRRHYMGGRGRLLCKLCASPPHPSGNAGRTVAEAAPAAGEGLTAAEVIRRLCDTLDTYGPGDTEAEKVAKAWLAALAALPSGDAMTGGTISVTPTK